MIEFEKTYLAKSIPEGLERAKREEIIDIYIPKSKEHPVIRIRKKGNKYEITKKVPINEDRSVQKEQTIILTEEEFKEFSKLEGKVVRKIRFYYNYNGRTAEIDVFKGGLQGLILVDFEFKSEEEKKGFAMPEFCLADVTQENFVAGGMLCGKTYADIEKELSRFGYVPLEVNGV